MLNMTCVTRLRRRLDGDLESGAHTHTRTRTSKYDHERINSHFSDSDFQIGTLQKRLRDTSSSQSLADSTEILKQELTRRDDTIQKLRGEVLSLQEKRDDSLAEVESSLNFLKFEIIFLLSQMSKWALKSLEKMSSIRPYTCIWVMYQQSQS